MEHEETKNGAADRGGESGAPLEPPATSPTRIALTGQVAAGLALIVLGGALLALEQLDGAVEHLFLVLVGGVFVAGYFYKKVFGFLVPGALLLGLGAGMAAGDLSEFFAGADGATLGLGVGFLLIWGVSLLYERANRWWPLIPGGALVVAGLPHWEWTDPILDYWPLAVMAVGVLLLARGALRRQKEDA